jgi:hypothetical protein
MVTADRISTVERRYSLVEQLVDFRRNALRDARAVPPGVRNQHRQIAVSLRARFRSQIWLRVDAWNAGAP